MISLFCVEDERIPRESIRKNVPWAENGIEYAGDAPDGEMALPQILEKKPDIVITDIKMPFMDGLELTRILREKLPGTHVILLSGYDEFDYARQAISMGVSDYLLKPVSAANLLAAVGRVRDAIERARGARSHPEQAMARREVFFSSLYSGFLSSASQILERAAALSIPLEAQVYQVVVASLDPPVTEHPERWKSLLYQAPETLASGFSGERVVYLLQGADRTALDAAEAQLARWAEDFGRQYGVTLTLVKGGVVQRLGELSKSYQTASLRRENRRNGSEEQLIEAKPFDREELLEFLRIGRGENARTFWENYRPAIERTFSSYIYRCYLLTELIFTIRQFVDEIHAPTPAALTDGGLLERWSTADCTAEDFIDFGSRLCEEVMADRGGAYVSAVDAARRYVDDHYADSSLSLSTAAKAVGVSPNHLSTVFKEKQGIGFSDYVTNMRIRQAKRLLTTTDLRTSEIGERVGYQNPNYFGMLFKKVTGVSPNRYRGEHSS